MKKTLYILLGSILFMTSCDSDPVLDPQPTYHTFSGDIGTNDNSTLISNDNNLVICGNESSNLSIIKISMTGDLIWRNDFSPGSNSISSGIVQTSTNELFICGKSGRNYATSQFDILLVKTNSSGDTIWSKTYGGIEDEYGTNIIATSDGNLLISGKTESFGAGTSGDLYLIKVNLNGDTIWTKSYPDPDQEVPFHLLETQNGEYLVTGTNEDSSSPRELYLLKVNTNGGQIWNQKIGPATWKWGYSTIELSNGDLLTCGQHTTAGYAKILIVKTDNLGNVIWENEIGENNLSEIGYSIKPNADGTFTIAGSSYDVSTTQSDIVLFKVDQNGNQVWRKKFGSNLSDRGMNLLKDSNGDNIITGDYNGGIFMARTDSNGVYQ